MPNIDNVLATESGRIDKKLLKLNRFKSPICELMQNGSMDYWPAAMGASINRYLHQRSGLSGSTTWSDVSFNDNTGNTCAPTATTINPAHDLESYNLQQMALESHNICVLDAMNAVEFKQQLDYTYENLADNARWEWEQRHRSEYIRLAQNKVVLATNFPTGDINATTWSTTVAARGLSLGVLKKYVTALNRDAGGSGSVAKVDGAPIYTAIVSQETYDNIKLDNAALRDDIREGGRNAELLAALGITHTYNGIAFVVDPDVPRYTHTGSSWVEVEPYSDDATVTEGTARKRNPTYTDTSTALFEDTIIFHPDVLTCQVPRPPASPGGNTKFTPPDYYGKWSWKNIINMDSSSDAYNPDGTYGKFRGVFMAASKPGKPQYGYVIRHKVFDFSNQTMTSLTDA